MVFYQGISITSAPLMEEAICDGVSYIDVYYLCVYMLASKANGELCLMDHGELN